MKQKFINCSNHPSIKWNEKQRSAALSLAYEIIDLKFPDVDPSKDEQYINELSDKVSHEIIGLGKDLAIMVQGESNLCFSLITKLKSLSPDYDCYAATTKRNTIVEADGTKKVNFEFERFRKY
ncbi:MAG: hypothetical protein ACP5OG_03270 [Candidatus Nanoarchaeia archaeon]